MKKGIGILSAIVVVIAGLLYPEIMGLEQETVEKPIIKVEDSGNQDDSDMEVHYIDVGQGDATLIINGAETMLIDTGDNSCGTLLQNYLEKQGVTSLDYLILTHTDADHIGGADVIVTKFLVDTVYMGDYPKDNKTYGELIDAIEYKNMTFSTPKAGESFMLADAMVTIIGPNESYDNPNDTSICLQIEKGDTSFTFTGDAEEETEADMIASGLVKESNVYQVGHHGSSSSSSEEFLDKLNCQVAVISCEEGNKYGHPHAEIINSLRQRGILVYRMDEQGSIIAISDGTEITFNAAPSESWKVGE